MNTPCLGKPDWINCVGRLARAPSDWEIAKIDRFLRQHAYARYKIPA